MTVPFIIFAKARSRTFWLSKFLTHGGWTCHHDPSLRFRDMADLATLLLPGKVGLIDTSLAFRWRDVLAACPDARVAVVRRDVAACQRSLERIGMGSDKSLRYLRLAEDALLEIMGAVKPLVIDFDSMHAGQLRRLWSHCLRDEPWDVRWFRAMDEENLQVDIDAEIRRVSPVAIEAHRFYDGAVRQRIERTGL